MSKKNLVLVLAATGLSFSAGCADPCLDDGLSQDPGSDADCPAITSGGETDSSSDSETESDSAETDSESESDTLESDSDSATDTNDPACSDGVQNGDETDVDCGGACGSTCTTGEGCNDGEDCVSMECDTAAGVCVEPTCDDGVRNGDETDVDCGGSCGPTCETGEMCNGGGDCISMQCDDEAGVCIDPSSCEDGEQNGDETDVDCGGSCGPTCDNGEMCEAASGSDCISMTCDDDAGVCIGPECDDGERNGDETDVDCGGSCGATCEDGEMCDDGADCISMVCDEGPGVCVTPTSWCVDDDDDSYGDPDNCTEVGPGETPPDGTVPNADDCDDTSEFTFPGAAPNDSATECMEDKDGDDWGDDDPGGPNTTVGTDCDDDSATAASVFPGAAANDSLTACMEDKDGDDWGDDDPDSPDATAGTDCDDDSAAAADTFPGAAPNDSLTACMEDKDGDDWGDDDPASDDAVDGTDCDDDSATAASTFPGAAENEPGDDCMKDEDEDGWGDDSPPAGVDAGSDCDEDGQPPCALLSTQDGTLNDTYDMGLNSVLVGNGFDVTVVEDTDATLADANGFTVVVISETSLSTEIGGTFRDAIVPVICLEGLVWDNMSMAPEADNTSTGDVDILAVGSPLAGGLSMTHDVISGIGSGLFYTTPPAGAIEVASVTGQPGQVTYFAFDQGATMVGPFVAPRRRVGLGYDADQAGPPTVVIEDDGLTLFEAALIWATE